MFLICSFSFLLFPATPFVTFQLIRKGNALTTILPLRYTYYYDTKFVALISVIGLATVCVVQAQSPSPAESPAASPSPAEKAASPSPAKSPAASPKAKPTPKKAKAERKARPAATPAPAGRTTEEATNPPASGGGHGQVWVNTETRVYQSEERRVGKESRFRWSPGEEKEKLKVRGIA